MKDLFNDMPFSSDNDITGQNRGNNEFHGEPRLSMDEFEELRLLLDNARASFAAEDSDIIPDPRIHKNLRAMVSARKKKFELPVLNLQKVLNFPVPAYQVGLAMTLVFFMIVLTGKRTGSNMNSAGIVHKVDTIYDKVYKKSSTIVASIDSQSKKIMPAAYSADYTDSIDMDFGSNSSQDQKTILGEPGNSPGQNSPALQQLNNPGEMDIPDKGGSYLEDTSKWNKSFHGLM
jgi:hypothetical protein